jgi:hypothetical protein
MWPSGNQAGVAFITPLWIVGLVSRRLRAVDRGALPDCLP